MRRALLATAATLALSAALLPATAAATPGHGISAVTVFDHVAGNTDYVFKEITIQPGGNTGWHYHSGRVFGVVKEGTLTRTMADCKDVVSPEGSAVTEDSGPNAVHIGRNLGPVPVKLWVDYIEPAGSPQAVDVPDPGCGI